VRTHLTQLVCIRHCSWTAAVEQSSSWTSWTQHKPRAISATAEDVSVSLAVSLRRIVTFCFTVPVYRVTYSLTYCSPTYLPINISDFCRYCKSPSSVKYCKPRFVGVYSMTSRSTTTLIMMRWKFKRSVGSNEWVTIKPVADIRAHIIIIIIVVVAVVTSCSVVKWESTPRLQKYLVSQIRMYYGLRTVAHTASQ